MANTINFSELPALITITNSDNGVVDRAATVIDNKQVKKAYITEPQKRKIQLFRVNLFKEIEPGDSLKIIANTSEEVTYYKNLENDFITVKVEKADAE